MNKMLLATTLLLSTLMSSIANAKDNRGWFVGPTLGNTSVKISSEGNRNTDNGDVSFAGVNGGFKFSSWFTLEGQYFQTQSIENAGEGGDYLIRGFSVAPKFSYSVSDYITLFGKLGIGQLNYKQQDHESSIFYDDMWQGVGEVFGMGIEYHISQNLNLMLTYDHMEATVENGDDYLFFSFSESFEVSSDKLSVTFYYQF